MFKQLKAPNDSPQQQNTEMFDFRQFMAGIKSLSDFSNTLEKGTLAGYFKGTSVSGSDRLRNFTSWLGKNDAQLTAQLQRDFKSGMLKVAPESAQQAAFFVGLWLGGRYLESQYPAGKKPAFPQIVSLPQSDLSKLDLMGYDPDTKRIEVGWNAMQFVEWANKEKDNRFCLLAGLSVGIHEHTHVLPRMKGVEGIGLSEIATYITTSTLALPVKLSGKVQAVGLIFGVRDRNHIMNEFESGRLAPSLPSDIVLEYVSYFMGPWIKEYLAKRGAKPDIFSFTTDMSKEMREPELDDYYKETPVQKRQATQKYFEHVHIKDWELDGRVRQVFAALEKNQCKSQEELVEYLKAAMGKAFGVSPSRDEVPQGFVELLPTFDEKGKTFASFGKLVPNKKKES